MKKSKLFLMLLALVAFGQTAWAQYSGGTGTEADPYLISSKADWNTLSTQVKNGNLYTGKFFKMTADIGTVTTPIGYTSDGSFYNDDVRDNFFEGTFDGNGQLILSGIDGNSVLQIIDVNGRVLSSRNATNRIGTDGLAAGVYVLHLIKGDNVKTQKIVIQ